MAIDVDASRAAAADSENARLPSNAVRRIELDAALDLSTGAVGNGSERTSSALNEALHHPEQADASSFGNGEEPQNGVALPGLALSAAPVMDYTHQRSGSSVMEVLRGVVTLTGARTAPQPSRTGVSTREGDSLLGMLQPLALDLIEASLTDKRVIDGTMVFSLLGRGTFVVEAARDGTGVVLSELNSGLEFMLGGDPARQQARPESASWDRDQSQVMPAAHWRETAGEESMLWWILDAIFALAHALATAVIWAATNPVVLALAVPVSVVAVVIGVARRRAAPEMPDTAPPVQHDAAAPARGAAPARRRRVARRRRRRTWSMLVGQVREAIGFPDAETLRERDFAAPRVRTHRAPKSA